MKALSADLLIIGGGIAGLYALLTARSWGASVVLASKTGLRAGSTYWAQGGVAAPLGWPDETAHECDTLSAGRGLCEPEAAYLLKVECEVETLDELREALDAGADRILLDNMTNELLAESVRVRDALAPQVSLEASGNMGLARLPDVAATGVDFVSVGALTHSAPSLDISLRIAKTLAPAH